MKVKNVLAYFKQRFPPVNMVLFAILFINVYSIASYFSSQPINFSVKIGLGIIAFISFFFRLRVFDEVKDYKIDQINHPDRVLQSGRVTLNQLFLLSAILTVSELVWSYWCGPLTLICWLVAVGYSLLMRYEFFIGSFLSKRLLLYACTHMVIMPFVMVWVWSAFNPDLHHPALYLLAGISLLCGFSFELARKIHAPAAERETVDSYSKSLGYVTSIICVLLVLLIGVVVQCRILYTIESNLWTYITICLLYLAIGFLFIKVVKRPDEKKLRLAELLVSLFMVISYISVIIEIHLKS